MTDPRALARVSVIIISWNTRLLLERCLSSVYASWNDLGDLEVLVVDNGSSDGSPEMVNSRFPEAILIANAGNVGFARACNLGMQQARGEYFLLLNPDTELVGSALPGMVRIADEHPEVAILGPQLLNSDGTPQSSRRRFPTNLTAFVESTVLQQWLPNHQSIRHFYALDQSDYMAQRVDWLVGACLLVRANAARQVGLMDEGYFMYSEELDWCRRFAGAGWKVLYHPAARVYHHGGQSSGQDIFHRHTRFQYSKARYFEKYHGRLLGQMVRTFLLANYLFMLVEDVAKLLLLRRNRSMRRQRVSRLAKVVAWMIKWVIRPGHVQP